MLDTVIVGGGLCGLALADELRQAGRPYALFEARERLGGRVYSEASTLAEMPVDLGPSWFWPETQPRMQALVKSCGLAYFPQYDTGEFLSLTDPNKPPEALTVNSVHDGAHRLVGGMGALTDALAQRLDCQTIHLQHELKSVEDKGGWIELQFQHNDSLVTVQARHVVLAVPPRLLDEHVSFMPALDGALQQIMRATYTWMADQAKAVMGYASPFWREAGHSGNAFVSHEQVVLAEIYDACDETGHSALGGFVAMPPEIREPYRMGMPMLLESQMVQVFGRDAGNGELHYRDWANERHTCATLDRSPPVAQPVYGNRRLREQYWGGKLLLGGSETASHAGGYMEGALDAAARLYLALSASHVPLQPASTNADALARFGAWVSGKRSQTLDCYRAHLNRLLALQVKERLTQQALLDAAEQMYNEALLQIEDLHFDRAGVMVEQGRSALTPAVLAPFNGYIRELVDTALEFNRGSCAMSNFPDEQVTDKTYMDVIRRDLASAWQEFALSVNDAMLGRAPEASNLPFYDLRESSSK